MYLEGTTNADGLELKSMSTSGPRVEGSGMATENSMVVEKEDERVAARSRGLVLRCYLKRLWMRRRHNVSLDTLHALLAANCSYRESEL